MIEKKLKKIADEIRYLMIQSIRPLESHHIGCAFSIVDIVVFIYFKILRVYPKNPKNEKRDIFILSKGHAALAVYATLQKKGFFSKKYLLNYDRDGSILSEHINHQVPGVEISTGSLGHGLPIGVGWAISFLRDDKKNKVYVLISDGELNEGSNWEAIMFAAHHCLHNLIVILDNNEFQGYSSTKNVINLSPLSKKLEDFGWNVYKIDGHNFLNMENVFNKIKNNKNKKPNFIIAKTIKGKGLPGFEGKFESHYKSIDQKTKETILKSFDINF